MPDLCDRIALVTGASRGAGAAVAAVLGEAGATVYVTGRSSRAGARTDDMPGTVEDSAAQVSARGGTGIGVVCDHTDTAQVEALVARIGADHGRLDVLVNNAWGGYEQYDGATFAAPFWEQTGELLTAGDLARAYGFTDVDGSQPEAFRIPSAS